VRRPDARRGQTLVEFALVLPVFILILVGIFDFGRAIFAYNTLLNASREAARQAVVDQTLTHIEDRAIDHAVALGITGADVTVDYRTVDALDTPDSCSGRVNTPQIVGCVAVVRVEYTYDAAVPLISGLVGQIELEGESRFPVHHDCQEPTQPQCPLGE
jgi:Flp pilus assembly protein TadG